MKKFFYLILGISILSSCTEDVDSCVEIDKTSVSLGESVKVTDCSSNAEYTIVDYGDGSDSAEFSGPKAITYHKAGIYTITLYAYDNYGYKKSEVEVTVSNPVESELTGKWRLDKNYNWYTDQEYLYASPVVFDINNSNVYYKLTDYGTVNQDSLNSSYVPLSTQFKWVYSSSSAQMSMDINDRELVPYFPNTDNDQLYIYSISETELILSDKEINPTMIYTNNYGNILDYGYDNLYYFTKVQ